MTVPPTVKEELANLINNKERELLELQEQYNETVKTEKQAVLKAKTTGMEKTNYLLSFDFKSSSQRTPQYLEFHRVFKKEFTALLKPFCSKIEVSKPNHFDVSGFFETNTGKIYYFSVSDLRWDKSFLIRTAKDFEDYTGGSNNFIDIEKIEEKIKPYLA